MSGLSRSRLQLQVKVRADESSLMTGKQLFVRLLLLLSTTTILLGFYVYWKETRYAKTGETSSFLINQPLVVVTEPSSLSPTHYTMPKLPSGSQASVPSPPATDGTKLKPLIDSISVKQSICPSNNGDSAPVVNHADRPDSEALVLVLGSTSFLGSRIASHLQKLKYNVKPLEVLENLPIDSMGWYRWQKLKEENVNPEFIETKKLNDIISDKKVDSIVFVPSYIFDGQSFDKRTMKLELATKLLHDFVQVLEAAVPKNIEVILLSLSESAIGKHHSIQKSWLRTLEVSLSAYHNLYGLKVRLIKMKDVYGPWQDIYNNTEVAPPSCVSMANIEGVVEDILKRDDICIDKDMGSDCIGNDDSSSETVQWIDEQRQSLNTRKDVIFSSYVVDSRNPIYNYQTKPNSAIYMKMWFLSAVKFKLNLAIWNDEFNSKFKDRITQVYPHVDFMKTPSGGTKGRSPNDYRYYVFYRYLIEHPEVKRAFLTDMRDVRFFGDPFERMDVLGDEFLYVGTSVPFYLFPHEHNWVNSIITKCHRSDAGSNAIKLHPHLNAGVLGGTRAMLLSFLTQMLRYLNKAPHSQNCNMGTIALVAHKHFHGYIFTGYPIQSAFKIMAAGPPGLAIKHKDTD